jgi:hypothetical protein
MDSNIKVEMPTIKLLTDLDKFIVFVDRSDEKRILAFKKEELHKKKELTDHFGSEINVPDNFTIKVFELEQVRAIEGTILEYDIINETPFEFPINRIKWAFIKSSV